MKHLLSLRKKLENFVSNYSYNPISSVFKVSVLRLNPFWVQLCYFLSMSIIGYLSLKMTKPRSSSVKPHDLDIFFTSVSAVTASSMATVDMEVFSNSQLIIITILMLVGGEVFISLLHLQFLRSRYRNPKYINNNIVFPWGGNHQYTGNAVLGTELEIGREIENGPSKDNEGLKYASIECLAYIVFGYILLVHLGGSALILLYVDIVPSAMRILQQKGIYLQTFSVFTTVSTIANCGFLPTNENMIVFRKNPGLLLLLVPLMLLGNTLYPCFLRLLIWFLEKITRREKLSYLLKHGGEFGYPYLFSRLRCCFLVGTVLGLILVQFILFCSMEWNSETLEGLDPYEKVVDSLFETVNSRHTGESVFDLSGVSPALLVLFVAMMYLPPHMTFLPIKDPEVMTKEGRNDGKDRQTKITLLHNLVFSQLSYIAIFIILVCITERRKMKKDPLNFNVLNITLEVISAYGNVGFSTGYSCKRQINPDMTCKDAWYGFVGRWSAQGKIILIVAMFSGRLKKYNISGGKAWIL